jgi:hypothetical protein
MRPNSGRFVFDHELVTANTGTMTIGDGAMLPLGGTIDSTGAIQLGATAQSTALEAIVQGLNRGRYRVARPSQKTPLSIWLSVSVCSLRSRTRRAVARGPAALLDLRCAHRPSERQIGTAE